MNRRVLTGKRRLLVGKRVAEKGVTELILEQERNQKQFMTLLLPWFV